MNGTIIPSAEGCIEQLVMTFRNDPPYRALVKELVLKLPRYTQLFLFIESGDNPSVIESYLASFLSRQQFVRHQPGLDIQDYKCVLILKKNINSEDNTRWIRDPYMVLQSANSDKPILLKSKITEFEDAAENLCDQRLVQALILQDQCFNIDGGNILVDPEFILVGGLQVNTLVTQCNSQPYTISNENKAKKLLRSILGIEDDREILFIGGPSLSTEPEKLTYFDSRKEYNKASNSGSIFDPNLWFPDRPEKSDLEGEDVTIHLDMFISITGERIEDKPIIMVAQFIALTPIHAKIAAGLEQVLSEIINKQLRPYFWVLRNPVPILWSGPSPYGNQYYGMYNNCLIENTPIRKNVWIPSFHFGYDESLEAFDEINKKLWESLQFEVTLIQANFHKFAQNRGALHCLTNELKRSI